jgi:hypothetical protein
MFTTSQSSSSLLYKGHAKTKISDSNDIVPFGMLVILSMKLLLHVINPIWTGEHMFSQQSQLLQNMVQDLCPAGGICPI